MDRVDALSLHITKLVRATGVVVDDRKDVAIESLDGITSDLDIEALTKGLLDISQDLDQYLEGLLRPEKSTEAVLTNEIQTLEKDLTEKKRLMDANIARVAEAEESLRKLKDQQEKSIYNVEA